MRVFSFGLGDGCDKNLVKQSAKAGRGTSTIVEDNDPNLNGLVIRALATAMEPSMKNTRYGFNDRDFLPEDELYRNSLVFASEIFTAAEFENLKFFFKTTASETNEELDL